MTTQELKQRRCIPCEGGVPTLTPEEVQQNLKYVDGWRLTRDGQRIRKDWLLQDFQAGLDLFAAVGKIAEGEQHHPDLHLENYRMAWIEVYTHAIGGLSANDFILAAKIDEVPVRTKGGGKLK